MKKTLFLLLTLSLVNCSNDDVVVTSSYSEFLTQKLPQFTAVIDDQLLNWSYGDEYQMDYTFMAPEGNDGDPHLSLGFRLSQDDGANQFLITTPLYDTSSEVEYNKVFALGVKKIGDASDEFHIRLVKNNVVYEVCDSDAGYTIEILKTQQVITGGPANYILKVWFKIDNIELNKCNPNTNKSLNNGLVMAHFMWTKY